MKDLILALITWTAAHSGYDMPPQPPTIEYRPASAFATQVCPGGSVHCAARAYYQDGTDSIVLHESYRGVEDVRAHSILVHEIIHYLQDRSGRWGEKTCQSWVEREHEAFRLQFLYLVTKTGNYHYYMPVPDAAQCEQG